jgi:nucleotide-binding universal stress UspA family protein
MQAEILGEDPRTEMTVVIQGDAVSTELRVAVREYMMGLPANADVVVLDSHGTTLLSVRRPRR